MLQRTLIRMAMPCKELNWKAWFCTHIFVQNFECICSNSKMYIFVLQRIELQKAVLSELHRIVLILTAMCCTELDCTEVTNALLCNTVQVGCSVELDAV